MDTQARTHRQRVDDIIDKVETISNIDEIIPYLGCIGIDNLKNFVANNLKNEILHSTQIVNRLFLATQSIQNILCIDLIQTIICHLNPKEIHCCIALLNTEFNQLLKTQTMSHKLLCYHPMFKQIFIVYRNEYFVKNNAKCIKRKTFIGSKMSYTLQNEYTLKILNECLNNWQKLGKTLYGHDKYIWNLCNYCKLTTKLCGEIGGDCHNYYTNCFQNIHTSYDGFGMRNDEIDILDMDRVDLNSCSEINNDGYLDIYVTSHYKHRKFYYTITPTLLIDLPDTKFRNKIKKSVNDDLIYDNGNNDDCDDDDDDEYPEVEDFYEQDKIQQFGMWF